MTLHALTLLAALAQAPLTVQSPTHPVADGVVMRELEETIVWRNSDNPVFTLRTLADYAAPIVWFSPDEPLLRGGAVLPEPLPGTVTGGGARPRVVYYNIPRVLLKNDARCAPLLRRKDRVADEMVEWEDRAGAPVDPDRPPLDCLDSVKIRYFFYYQSEVGTAAHANDFESVQVNVDLVTNAHFTPRDVQPPFGGSLKLPPLPTVFFCGQPATAGHCAVVSGVFGSAHGIAWYTNGLNVHNNGDTTLPITVLVEEGKHASAPDRNADGIYTPGFDVDIHPSDAWGVRDILRTRWLQGPAFRADMAKRRLEKDLVFPPNPNRRLSASWLRRGPFHVADDRPAIGSPWDDKATYELRNVHTETTRIDGQTIDLCERDADQLSTRIPDDLGCGIARHCEQLKDLFRSEEGCRATRVWPKKGWIVTRAALAKVNAGGSHDEYLTWPRFFRERVAPSVRVSGSSYSGAWTVPIGWNVPGIDGWLTARVKFRRVAPDDAPLEGLVDGVYSVSAAQYMSLYAAFGRDTLPATAIDPATHAVALEAGFKWRFEIPKAWIFSGVRVGVRTDGPGRFRFSRLVIEAGGGSW